jgi:uncharacterized membrane protein
MAVESRTRTRLGEFRPGTHHRRNTYQEVQARLGFQDRIALTVTGAIGTMYAVYVFAVFMGLWMAWQIAVGKAAFDPYPFAFLLFMGNIVQLLLMPLIMVGQNLQSRHAEARSEEEFETVGRIFHDLETALTHLDAQDGELLSQTRLLTALVESLVPAPQRAAALAAAGLDAHGDPLPGGPGLTQEGRTSEGSSAPGGPAGSAGDPSTPR